MPGLKFNKGTDGEHRIKLDSYLVSDRWSSGAAYAGHKARFEVRTALVGNGIKIEIEGKSDKGKKLGNIKGTIENNIHIGEFGLPGNIEIRDKIYFKIKASKVKVQGNSESIPVLPRPGLKSIGWDKEKACRGDILTLSAKTENVQNESEVMPVTYEYDRDSPHDRVCEISATVEMSTSSRSKSTI